MGKGFRNLSYKDRLTRLGLTSLADRRIRSNLIETQKIVIGKERVHMNDFCSLR